MSRTKKVAVAVAGGLLVLAAGAVLWDVLTSDEDRPVIRVKGRSISFSNDRQWTGQDVFRREWKPNHPRGKPVQEFHVTSALGQHRLPGGDRR